MQNFSIAFNNWLWEMNNSRMLLHTFFWIYALFTAQKKINTDFTTKKIAEFRYSSLLVIKFVPLLPRNDVVIASQTMRIAGQRYMRRYFTANGLSCIIRVPDSQHQIDIRLVICIGKCQPCKNRSQSVIFPWASARYILRYQIRQTTRVLETTWKLFGFAP